MIAIKIVVENTKAADRVLQAIPAETALSVDVKDDGEA